MMCSPICLLALICLVSCLHSSEMLIDFQQMTWPYFPDPEPYSGDHQMDEVVTGISLITDHPITGISSKYALALPLPMPLPTLSCSSMGLKKDGH